MGISYDIKGLILAQRKELDAGYKFTTDDGMTYSFRGLGISLLTLNEFFEYSPLNI